MRIDGLVCLRRASSPMMMVVENVHQRTSEKQQIGRCGKRVACMRCQQVDAERCRDESYS